jgi:hypothetical protein
MEHITEKDDTRSETSTEIANSWNDAQEGLLKAISERSNCMRWLHTQCNYHFDSMNFYLTIPNIILSTLNGGFTMSLTSVFPDLQAQHIATIIIGIISIFSAVLTTLNQYIKSQQMMEAHRSASISYGKLNRTINNELALRRDQRSNAIEFLKIVRSEQDRLENTAPSILPHVIHKFNKQFADRDIEKPEIAGDLDETTVNSSSKVRVTPAPLTIKPRARGARTNSSPVATLDRTPFEALREPLTNQVDTILFPPQTKSNIQKE